MKFIVARTFKGHNVLFRMPVSTAIVLFWVHEGMTFLLLSTAATAANAFCCPLVLLRSPYAGAPSPRGFLALHISLTKRPDTVGQPPSAEICVSNMPALKAKKLRQLLQEKVLLELCRGLANSIRPIYETSFCRTAGCN
jgi:hypothetical protein